MIEAKRLVRQAFSRAAPSYDGAADFQREAGRRLMAECDLHQAPMRVLDAGCGTGHGLQMIRQRWPEARTIALDFAVSMLRQIQPFMAAEIVCGDIERLPMAAASVDLVWSSLALQWCDLPCVLGELYRVLQARGYLVASTLGKGTFAELDRAFVGVDAFRHTNDFVEIDALRRNLVASGFDSIQLSQQKIIRHYPDLRALLGSVRELGANHVTAGNRRPGLMGKVAWQRFQANYEKMRTAQGLPLTYSTFFIVGRK